MPLTVPEAFLENVCQLIDSSLPPLCTAFLLCQAETYFYAASGHNWKKDRNVQYDSYIIQLISYPGEMRREGIRMSISSTINRRNNFQLHKVYVVWSQQDLQLEGKNKRQGSKK